MSPHPPPSGAPTSAGFVLLDHETFEVKGAWEKLGADETIDYGYDFWYQPHFDVLVSTSWGSPEVIFNGFGAPAVAGLYRKFRCGHTDFKTKMEWLRCGTPLAAQEIAELVVES